MSPYSKNVSIEVGGPQAVVLFELLTRLGGLPASAFADPAEQHVIWELQTAIERKIPEVFSPGYKTAVDAARAQIRNEAAAQAAPASVADPAADVPS